MEHKNLCNVLYIIFGLVFLITPLISAYSWGYYGSPLDYFENEWFLFFVLFLIFFATIFYTLEKSFKNRPVAGVIALGLSLLITLALTRKGLLIGYSNGLDMWVLLIAVLIGLGFLLGFAKSSFGAFGTIGVVVGVWLLIQFIDPYAVLPNSLLESAGFMLFYESFLKSPICLVILIVLAALITPNNRNQSLGYQLVNRLFTNR
jgi:hypothetical protein